MNTNKAIALGATIGLVNGGAVPIGAAATGAVISAVSAVTPLTARPVPIPLAACTAIIAGIASLFD